MKKSKIIIFAIAMVLILLITFIAISYLNKQNLTKSNLEKEIDDLKNPNGDFSTLLKSQTDLEKIFYVGDDKLIHYPNGDFEFCFNSDGNLIKVYKVKSTLRNKREVSNTPSIKEYMTPEQLEYQKNHIIQSFT